MTTETFANHCAEFSTTTITHAEYVTLLRQWGAEMPAGQISGPCSDVVRRGHDSPYQFANKLRNLCGDNEAAILRRTNPPAGKSFYFAEPFGNGLHQPTDTAILATYVVTH